MQYMYLSTQTTKFASDVWGKVKENKGLWVLVLLTQDFGFMDKGFLSGLEQNRFKLATVVPMSTF